METIKYQAFKNDALSDGIESLRLLQNKEFLRNLVKRDAIFGPIAEVRELENLKKEKSGKRKIINLINALRRHFYAKELEVSKKLINEAKKLADKLLKTGDWYNYEDDTFGVLVYYSSSFEFSNPLDKWKSGSEKIDYSNINENTFPKDYAQLIWASTRQIGCIIRFGGRNRGYLFLCLFYPKGNIKGHYRENVRIE
uniref:SCP domain-containing protein n=1 Tax=Strongyloides papillosus TaxID=174720 RepID=A0A0N5BQW5_STREA